MQLVRARWLVSTALACALGGCSFQLYDKEKDDQAKAMKTGLAAVSFDEIFATAQANHNAVSEATKVAYQRSSDLIAKRALFVVLSTPTGLAEEDGLLTALEARWSELMCGEDVESCDSPQAVADAWLDEFCRNPSLINEACRNRRPVRFSRIVDLGLSDYDPNSLRIPGLRLSYSADNVLIASGRAAPKCVAQPIADEGLTKPVRQLPLPQSAIPTTAAFLQPLSEDAAKQTKPIYERYTVICQQTLQAQYELAWLVGITTQSEIGKAWTAWHGEADKLTRQRIAMRALQADYDKDNTEYKKALEDIAASKPDAEDKAEGLLGKASDALKAVEKANDFGIEFATEERLKALREVIAILGGDSKSSGADKSALTADVRSNLAALAKLPHIADESADLFAAAEEARLSPLILELSYQEQVLAGAKRRIAEQEATVERKRLLFFAKVAEAGRIGYALERTQDAAGLLAFGRQPLYELLKGAEQAPSQGQTALLDALSAYYESQVKYYSAQDKLAYDESAAAFQRNLNENQIALNEWLALSKSDSDILAAYFASGVKPEDLAALLVQLIGLGSIGVGVNR